MKQFFFYLTLACLLVHEMDAVKQSEWRVLPGFSKLPERWGYHAFLWSHLPLYWVIFLSLQAPSTQGLQLGLSLFAVIHLGLHYHFRKHRAYDFHNFSSRALILFAACAGTVTLFSFYSGL